MSPARQSADPNPLPPRLAALKSIMPSRGSMEKRPSAIKPPDIRQQLGMVGRREARLKWGQEGLGKKDDSPYFMILRHLSYSFSFPGFFTIIEQKNVRKNSMESHQPGGNP